MKYTGKSDLTNRREVVLQLIRAAEYRLTAREVFNDSARDASILKLDPNCWNLICAVYVPIVNKYQPKRT